MQEYADQENVVYARPLVQAKEAVTCVSDGLPTWVAELMSTAPTLQAAVEFVTQVRRRAPFHAMHQSQDISGRR